MKIFQIKDGFCYCDLTPKHQTIENTYNRYPKDILIVEAPDWVFEGFGYNYLAEGDERFVKPTPPEGFLYDEGTGTFYHESYPIMQEINELKQNLVASDYKAIKFMEGEISEVDYAPIKIQRQGWRARINELESLLNN